MAEWIPRCKGLDCKPEVLSIARATGRSRHVVADMLLDFWGWADEQTDDGHLAGLTLDDLPAVVPETDGVFWLAVVASGWLRVEAASLVIPNFGRWMGPSGREQILEEVWEQENRRREREKKRRQRARKRQLTVPVNRVTQLFEQVCPPPVPPLSPGQKEKEETSPPGPPPKEEREKGSPPTPPLGIPAGLDTPAVRAVWQEWLAYRRDRRLSCRPQTLQKQIEFLAALGPASAFVAAIEQSIRNGWQGLFPPRCNGRHDPPPEPVEPRPERLARQAREREEAAARAASPEEWARLRGKRGE